MNFYKLNKFKNHYEIKPVKLSLQKTKIFFSANIEVKYQVILSKTFLLQEKGTTSHWGSQHRNEEENIIFLLPSAEKEDIWFTSVYV